MGLAQFRPTSIYRWEVAAYLNEHGLHPSVVAEADDSLLLVEVAIHRSCIAIVPRSAARNALASGQLRVLADLAPPALAIHAMYLDNIAAGLTRRAIELLQPT